MNRNSNHQLSLSSLLLFLSACSFDSTGLGRDSSTTGNTTVNSSFNTFEFPTSNTSNVDDTLVTTGLDSTLTTGGSLTSDTFESTSTSTSSTLSDSDSDSTENRASTEEMISICGNYIVESTEECDEGPGSENCTEYCKISFCGDGNINLLANEECDDENLIDEDECSNECVRPRWVFLTSDYIGPPKFGGIKQADDFCQSDAIKFGYSGIFRAWLSDSDPLNDPIIRFGDFSTFKGWYRLPSDPPLPVVKGPNFQFGLLNSINVMPMGSQDLMVISVWTNTQSNGLAVNNEDNCNNWTLNEGSSLTYVGSPHSIASDWTMYGWKSCSSGVGSKLYCFETNQ